MLTHLDIVAMKGFITENVLHAKVKVLFCLLGDLFFCWKGGEVP
jgi:hypothetical protein